MVESYGTHHPHEIHQVELVTFVNTVKLALDLVQFPNESSTMWRTINETIIPRGNYYARILGRTFSNMDFAIYAFPAFESIAEPGRSIVNVYDVI